MPTDPMDPQHRYDPVMVTIPVHDVPIVTCRATNRKGQGCKLPAIPGGAVCRFHGGSAPQVREAARKRLLALVPEAIGTMVDLLDADSEAVRFRAAADILDRSGLKPADEVTVVAQASTNEELDAAILGALAARGLGTHSGVALPQAPDQG